MIAATVPNVPSSSINPSVLISRANADRAENHLSSISYNPVLTAIAQAKANDMAAKGYFAHNSPDGKTPWYWFDQNHYVFSYAGENLAVDFTDTDAVETAWMNSPGHRANILNSHYTEVGIAVAVGTYEGHQTIFVAEEFGTPKAAVAAVAKQATPPAAKSAVAKGIAPPVKAAGAHTAPLAARSQPATQVLGAATVAPGPVATATQVPAAPEAPVRSGFPLLYSAIATGIAGIFLVLLVRRSLHRVASVRTN